MKSLDAVQTTHLLPFGPLADALDQMLRRVAAGEVEAPVRQHLATRDDEVLLVMPSRDNDYFCVKLITVHAGNPARGLPAIQGEVMLVNARDGRRLLTLDAAAVTSRRTAAMSLLGATKLAGPARDSMLLVGSGVQARAHLDAFAQNWPLSRLYLHSADEAGAQALARHARDAYRLDAAVVADAAAAAKEAALIVTATTSKTPVLHGPVRPDCTIVAIGAYKPDMAEIGPGLVQACDVYVDTLEGAEEEAGDLIQAGIDWKRVTPIERVVQPVGHHGRPVLFKTVGSALWDLAAARLAFERLSHAAATN